MEVSLLHAHLLEEHDFAFQISIKHFDRLISFISNHWTCNVDELIAIISVVTSLGMGTSLQGHLSWALNSYSLMKHLNFFLLIDSVHLISRFHGFLFQN